MKPYASYKPSGVPWLGDVPAHWEVKQARFVMTCNDDVLPENTSPEQVLDYIEISDVDEVSGIKGFESVKFSDAPSRARRLVMDGDVIVSTVRTYLRAVAAISNPTAETVVSTGFAVLRPRAIDSRYSKYAILYDGFISEVISRSKGISYPAINATDLVRISVPQPTPDEQQAIADYLDAETARIDTLIHEKDELIGLLREWRQSVIVEAVTKGLNKDAPMKASGVAVLGEVPSHWEVKKIRYVLEAIGDVDHFMPESVDKGVPYLMTGDLKDLVSEVSLDDCKQVAYKDYLALSKRIKSSKGDVVMARYATIGTAMYVDMDIDFLVSYSCVTLKPNQSNMSGLYLFQYMKSDAFLHGVENQINTNTQGNVGISDLQNVMIAVPPLPEQQAIADYLDAETAKIDDLIAHTNDEIALLKELRAATIADAVLGRVDVRTKN